MPIVPYADPKNLDDDAKRILGDAPRNIGRMMANTGALFRPWTMVALTFINNGSLRPALREMISLRVGLRLNAKYVVAQHQSMARDTGVTEEQISALDGPLPSPAFSESENDAIMLADFLIDGVRAPADLMLKVRDSLGNTQLHEIFIVSSFYQFAARYTESTGIDIDVDPNESGIEYMKKRDHLRQSNP